ncbi:MAG: hypothetical protein KAJ05_09315, partial [Candidatus Latescibacteria bacterium]|nr:hypothetical protein [Candidatus Latescibacterota bacterium]
MEQAYRQLEFHLMSSKEEARVTYEQLRNHSHHLEEMVEERTSELKDALVHLQNTQSQLIHSEKLASMGQLAAGIAHEINTPTQYIGDNTRFFQGAFTDLSSLLEKYHLLLESVKTGAIPQQLIDEVEKAEEKADLEFLLEEIPTAIKQSLEGIDRVTGIVQAMRAFSHPGVSE